MGPHVLFLKALKVSDVFCPAELEVPGWFLLLNFWGWETVHVVKVYQLWTFVKTYQIVHFKYVLFMLCQLYLSKGTFERGYMVFDTNIAKDKTS